VGKQQFYGSISSFTGASKRLERIASNQDGAVFKDFAHSPSKLKATIQAVKEQFPQRHLIACMELHTFSSLSLAFMEEYQHAMDLADTAIVFYSRHALELKRLPLFSSEDVSKAFKRDDIQVFNDSQKLHKFIKNQFKRNTNLLMMSSGNFDGLDLTGLAADIL
jgi:UDP-N-acetylmuramate: L-alanyl-gamma-D-glutamyl-meso-diaminopimelate ligase